MTENNRTHYRKAFNSPYLSSADIVEPTTLTISRVVLEGDSTKKTKDSFNTAYFEEKEIRPGERLKPMILNVHNSEVMRDMCGSPFIDDWSGTVTVYVDKNVRFGRETVEGLRLKAAALIDAGQEKTLSDLINSTESDRAAFLRWGGCKSLAQLPADKFSDAVRMLRAKNK